MTRHPIIDRFVKALSEAHDIYERFEEHYERPPTREECAMAATLYIETQKAAGKAGTTPATPDRSTPTTDQDIPDCCPECGDEMWDNRGDKLNERSPDFKCKDKACGHAIWLTPPPAKKKAAPQRAIADPEDSLPF